MSFAFSTYLSSGTNKWVACIELNNTNAFSSIMEHTERLSFRKSGIDFYPNSTLAEYSLLLKEHYDVLVLDFGVLNQLTLPEYLNCDMCLALGYISPWNSGAFWDWLVKNLSVKDKNAKIVVLGNLASPSNVKKFKHQYGAHSIAVPFLENPFQLTSGNFHFIERTLERNQYTTKLLFSGR